jgi:hypothetical protein
MINSACSMILSFVDLISLIISSLVSQPLTTLVILVASTWHAHLTLRVFLKLAQRPSAVEASC